MELFLDLVWAVLAVGGILAVLRKQTASREIVPGSHTREVIAVAVLVFLLFPVISASDDLHATQIILEDTSKRLCRATATSHAAQVVTPIVSPAALLALYSLFTLIALRAQLPPVTAGRVLEGERIPHDGRSPPR